MLATKRYCEANGFHASLIYSCLSLLQSWLVSIITSLSLKVSPIEAFAPWVLVVQ